MTNIIIAFPKAETGKSIKNILTRSGFHVTCVCTSGAMALTEAYTQHYGVVICAYRLSDMTYMELKENLPEGFSLVTIASRAQWNETGTPDVVCLNPPLKVHELVSTMEMVVAGAQRYRRKMKSRPVKRSDDEKKTIEKAKGVLMERNNMSEEEAHRYLQKTSMDTGRSLYEGAQMILSMMEL